MAEHEQCATLVKVAISSSEPDQLDKWSLISDSHVGNATFQRALIQCCPVKDQRDIGLAGKKRKAAAVAATQQSQCSSLGNAESSCKILVSFHEDQSSSIQYISSSDASQAPAPNAAISSFPAIHTNCSLDTLTANAQALNDMAQNKTCESAAIAMRAADDQRKKACTDRLSQKSSDSRCFHFIYENSEKIKLPNCKWGYHKNDKDDNMMLIFSKVRWFASKACALPLYERQVVLQQSNELKIYINNLFSPLESLRPRDIAQVEQILQDVDQLSVCSAGPSIEFAQTAALAQKDQAVGRWRHKYCPIVVAHHENICKYCSSINQVFRYPKQNRLPFATRPRAHAQKQQTNHTSSPH